MIDGSGIVVRYRGQDFRLVASEPYTRKDGQASVLLTWEADCLECSEPFTIKLGRVMDFEKKLCRRCPDHRKPGVSGRPVKPAHPTSLRGGEA